MFKNDWFEGRQLVKSPPIDAVIDCSRPGQDASVPVAFWVQKLNFDGPAWFIREHLWGFGCWDKKQLCDHNENRERLFWSLCCDIAEELKYDFSEYCGDGLEDKELPATLYLMY
ncbi:MAG: hypothetical protein ACO24H_03495 [Polynucleobacter sp.]